MPLNANAERMRLTRQIAALPEFQGINKARGAIARAFIRDNRDSRYFLDGTAPYSMMLDGGIGQAFGVKRPPLYYTITMTPGMKLSTRYLREGSDLGADMVPKNALAEVLFTGGKSVLVLDGTEYFASTCVYGDEELLQRGDVIAKGGVRIVASNILPGDEKNRMYAALEGYVRGFIGLGTLGISRIEGPDMVAQVMKAAGLDVDTLMEHLDGLGMQAVKDLNVELLPLTTSGRPENGYLSHNDWRGTSYGVLGYLCSLIQNRAAMDWFGIDTHGDTGIILQGFGEVGRNIARLLVERASTYNDYQIRILGLSDESGAYYNPEGFDPLFLNDVAAQIEQGALLDSSTGRDKLAPHRLDTLDEIVFMPATVLIPAGPSYSTIRTLDDVKKLQARMIVSGANTIIGTRTTSPDEARQIEAALLDRGIINFPPWMSNCLGITISKEEIIHRLMEGGLEGLKDPERRRWLKHHVLEGDGADTAWVNTAWAMHEFAKTEYSRPISDIMLDRVDEILEERKRILLGWPREATLLGNVLRQDSAIMRAKMSVLARDMQDQMPYYEAILSDPSAPVSERRVAAYILGKMGNLGMSSHVSQFMDVLQNPQEEEIMVRNAAVGIGLTLEGKVGLFGDTLSELQTMREQLGPISYVQDDEALFHRALWLEWAISMTTGTNRESIF